MATQSPPVLPPHTISGTSEDPPVPPLLPSLSGVTRASEAHPPLAARVEALRGETAKRAPSSLPSTSAITRPSGSASGGAFNYSSLVSFLGRSSTSSSASSSSESSIRASISAVTPLQSNKVTLSLSDGRTVVALDPTTAYSSEEEEELSKLFVRVERIWNKGREFRNKMSETERAELPNQHQEVYQGFYEIILAILDERAGIPIGSEVTEDRIQAFLVSIKNVKVSKEETSHLYRRMVQYLIYLDTQNQLQYLDVNAIPSGFSYSIGTLIMATQTEGCHMFLGGLGMRVPSDLGALSKIVPLEIWQSYQRSLDLNVALFHPDSAGMQALLEQLMPKEARRRQDIATRLKILNVKFKEYQEKYQALKRELEMLPLTLKAENRKSETHLENIIKKMTRVWESTQKRVGTLVSIFDFIEQESKGAFFLVIYPPILVTLLIHYYSFKMDASFTMDVELLLSKLNLHNRKLCSDLRDQHEEIRIRILTEIENLTRKVDNGAWTTFERYVPIELYKHISLINLNEKDVFKNPIRKYKVVLEEMHHRIISEIQGWELIGSIQHGRIRLIKSVESEWTRYRDEFAKAMLPFSKEEINPGSCAEFMSYVAYGTYCRIIQRPRLFIQFCLMSSIGKEAFLKQIENDGTLKKLVEETEARITRLIEVDEGSHAAVVAKDRKVAKEIEGVYRLDREEAAAEFKKKEEDAKKEAAERESTEALKNSRKKEILSLVSGLSKSEKHLWKYLFTGTSKGAKSRIILESEIETVFKKLAFEVHKNAAGGLTVTMVGPHSFTCHHNHRAGEIGQLREETLKNIKTALIEGLGMTEADIESSLAAKAEAPKEVPKKTDSPSEAIRTGERSKR